MLQGLGAVVRRAERFGLPVLAIMYPRKENGTVDDNYDNLKTAHPDQYSELVAHAARIGMELGADVIKTQYTGSPDTFARVVEAVRPVPVVIAGGPLRPELEVVAAAQAAVQAGARGVSIGRNVFCREAPARMLRLLHAAVHIEE